jgi:uncharacterized protein YcfJ
MNKKILAMGLIAALGNTGAAWAFDHDGPDGHVYRDRARVVDVKPIYRTVRVEHPRRECWDEQVRHRPAGYNSRTPVVLGGVIGGAIGNTMGKGNGRTAATVAGMLLGASIGNDMRHADRDRRAYVSTERVCRVVSDYSEEQRIDSYAVTYRYHGHTYVTRMDSDPGPFVRVRVAVDVVDR